MYGVLHYHHPYAIVLWVSITLCQERSERENNWIFPSRRSYTMTAKAQAFPHKQGVRGECVLHAHFSLWTLIHGCQGECWSVTTVITFSWWACFFSKKRNVICNTSPVGYQAFWWKWLLVILELDCV